MKFKQYISESVRVKITGDEAGKFLTDLNYKWIQRDNFFEISTSLSKEDLLKHLQKKKKDDMDIMGTDDP